MVVDTLHAGVAALGSVVITARPASSTATHSDVEGHEIAKRPAPSTGAGTVHAGVEAPGSVEITARP
jgi:hypothetical protein